MRDRSRFSKMVLAAKKRRALIRVLANSGPATRSELARLAFKLLAEEQLPPEDCYTSPKYLTELTAHGLATNASRGKPIQITPLGIQVADAIESGDLGDPILDIVPRISPPPAPEKPPAKRKRKTSPVRVGTIRRPCGCLINYTYPVRNHLARRWAKEDASTGPCPTCGAGPLRLEDKSEDL